MKKVLALCALAAFAMILAEVAVPQPGEMLQDSSPPLQEPGDTFSDALQAGGRGPEMVVIPAGKFEMGCVSGQECYEDEMPVHSVTISQPFAVSKYEITFEDYDRFRDPNQVDDEGWGRGRQPIMNVSWNDAREYVAWLSSQTGQTYRLLTEAEWEYAARAGSTTQFSWGNEIGQERANCGGCSTQWDFVQTAPVGSFAANAFGLHEMEMFGSGLRTAGMTVIRALPPMEMRGCMEMFGSGLRTAGMTVIRALPPMEMRGSAAIARSAFCAAAPTTTFRMTCAPRFASGTPPATAAAASVSALPGPSPPDS